MSKRAEEAALEAFPGGNNDIRDSFVHGYGRGKIETLEKVYKWLEENTKTQAVKIENLKKYMEEE